MAAFEQYGISIERQIKWMKQEIEKRQREYSALVDKGQITPEKMQRELAMMRAIKKNLEELTELNIHYNVECY